MLPRCGCGCGGQRNAAASANSASSQLILSSSSSTTNLPTQSSNIMSAAAVKLPLAVKKAIRDAEPETKKFLDRASAVIGSPVTYNYNLEAAWTAMEGHKDQATLPMVANQYLENFVQSLERECKDPMTKEQVIKLWKTKNLTLTIEGKDFDGREFVKNNVAVWGGENGLRLTNDGSFDVYTRPDKYWFNMGQLCGAKYSDLFKNVKPEAGELPLGIRQELIKEKDNIEKMKTRIAKAVGVDAVTWDAESNLSELLPVKIKAGWSVDVYQPLRYLTTLAERLETLCKDEMVKEAIQEAFSAKKVKFSLVDKMDGQPGLEMHDNYVGVQFLDGQIIVFATGENWSTNVNEINRFDLVKLF